MKAFIVLLATAVVIGDQKCGLVPTKVFLAKGEKRQLVFWTDQDYSMAASPHPDSPQATTSLPPSVTVEQQQEEEVDTFLQAVNGQLPGFGNSREPEIVTTEAEADATDNLGNELDESLANTNDTNEVEMAMTTMKAILEESETDTTEKSMKEGAATTIQYVENGNTTEEVEVVQTTLSPEILEITETTLQSLVQEDDNVEATTKPDIEIDIVNEEEEGLSDDLEDVNKDKNTNTDLPPIDTVNTENYTVIVTDTPQEITKEDSTVPEVAANEFVEELEVGALADPDGTHTGGVVEAVVAEDNTTMIANTTEDNLAPEVAANVIDEIEEDAWADPDAPDPLIPHIEAVVAEEDTTMVPVNVVEEVEEAITSEDNTVPEVATSEFVEEVEEEAWADPDGTHTGGNGPHVLLPLIEAVVAETTVSAEIADDDDGDYDDVTTEITEIVTEADTREAPTEVTEVKTQVTNIDIEPNEEVEDVDINELEKEPEGEANVAEAVEGQALINHEDTKMKDIVPDSVFSQINETVASTTVREDINTESNSIATTGIVTEADTQESTTKLPIMEIDTTWDALTETTPSIDLRGDQTTVSFLDEDSTTTVNIVGEKLIEVDTIDADGKPNGNIIEMASATIQPVTNENSDMNSSEAAEEGEESNTVYSTTKDIFPIDSQGVATEAAPVTTGEEVSGDEPSVQLQTTTLEPVEISMSSQYDTEDNIDGINDTMSSNNLESITGSDPIMTYDYNDENILNVTVKYEIEEIDEDSLGNLLDVTVKDETKEIDEDFVGNLLDVTVKYETNQFDDDSIGNLLDVTVKDETDEIFVTSTENNEIFDDDIDYSDKVSVVTSMSVDEPRVEEFDSDEVLVVTSSPYETPTNIIVTNFDDLVLDINEFAVEEELKDILNAVINNRTNAEEVTEEAVNELVRSEQKDTTMSILKLLGDFDFLGPDSGFIHEQLRTPSKDISESTEAITKNDEIVTGAPENISTTRRNYAETSILFGLDLPLERSTYFPLAENEIQDDDTDFYDDFDDRKTEGLQNSIQGALTMFDETTTGEPLKKEEQLEEEKFGLEAVEYDAEESAVFDYTTISGPSQEELVPVTFKIEAVEAEIEEPDYLEDINEQKLFDETTTGGSVGSPDTPDYFFEEKITAEVNKPKIEAVEAEEDTDYEEEYGIPETTESEGQGKVFDETTTGSSNILAKVPAVEPVVAEDEIQEQEEFAETTTGSYADNRKIQTNYADMTTLRNNITAETSDTATEETPAFTTASSKNTTTASFRGPETAVVSDNVVFPEVQDDKLEILKDIPAKNETEEESIELTTVRVEVGEEIVETTSRKIVSASDLSRTMLENVTFKSEKTTTISNADPTAATTPEGPVKDSDVVQVQAEGVNGPLNLDEAVYYDDTDDEENYNDNDETFVNDNQLTTEDPEETTDATETTTIPRTTIINGFNVNKNPVLETLDNNGIETVRTGGDIKIEISTEDVITDTTDKMEIVGNDRILSAVKTEDVAPIMTLENTEIIEETEGTEEMEELTTITNKIFNETESITEDMEDVSMNSTAEAGSEQEDTATFLPPSTVMDDTETSDDVIASKNDTEIKDENLSVSQNSTSSGGKRPPSKYPITELLNSIYRLVTGIRDSPKADSKATVEEEDGTDVENSVNAVEIQYFDSPLAQPLNVHNSPRNRVAFSTAAPRITVEESIDLANSNTDPFQQLSAPDLTGFIPDAEKEANVQYIFSSSVRKQEPARTLSPFNSDALRVEAPPKVLVQQVEETGLADQASGFSFSSLLPSFFSTPAENVQVAGSLPVTVRDSPDKLRRPLEPPTPQGGLLSSLFSRSTRRPALRARPRPLRPDVPAQNPTGFVPLVPGRQRGQPVSIPLPMQGGEAEESHTLFSPKTGALSREDTGRLLRFIDTRPLPLRNALLELQQSREKREIEEEVNCTWTIQTEKNLYLLVTFHNLSAPFTVDCEGAYIEVERENNGFEARWCGNRVTQGGSRPHVIFARNEVRITVFDDGLEGKKLPTGFNADVEVIDLFDAGQYSSLRKTNAYSSVRTLAGRSLVR